MPWVVRDGEVLASAEIAEDRRARRKGLVGRDHFEGALVLRPCRHVHTFRMRFPLDVACCDAGGRVLRTFCLRPWRLAPFVRGTRFVIEAREGSFDRWQLGEGDTVEVEA